MQKGKNKWMKNLMVSKAIEELLKRKETKQVQ